MKLMLSVSWKEVDVGGGEEGWLTERRGRRIEKA